MVVISVLGITVSVLSSVHPDVLCRRSTQTIFCLRLRGVRRRMSNALFNQSAYTERPILLLVRVEAPLPTSDKGDTQTKQRGKGSHKPT
jgi:hypothetical protein